MSIVEVPGNRTLLHLNLCIRCRFKQKKKMRKENLSFFVRKRIRYVNFTDLTWLKILLSASRLMIDILEGFCSLICFFFLSEFLVASDLSSSVHLEILRFIIACITSPLGLYIIIIVNDFQIYVK